MLAVLPLTAAVPPGTAAARHTPPPGAAEAAPQARTVDVMTRNLYLGADLQPVMRALAAPTGPTAVPGAATAAWSAVRASRPDERMAAVAQEIAAARPAVVGLQEVSTWTTYPGYDPARRRPVGPPTVAYDFLQLLLDALAEEGVGYEVVPGATAHNFASPPIPYFNGSSGGLGAVAMADRDVILRRSDVRARNPYSGTFSTIVGLPIAGGTLPVARGWGSVDVRTRLATFRFVNSHLEAFDAEGVRLAQVAELLAAQARVTDASGALPTVYVGDYNSRAPDGAAYRALLAGVGTDAWTVAGAGAGLTCCFDPGVRDPADPLTTRIDLVLVGAGITPELADVIGEDPQRDRTVSGLWPSDHAGVVARLVVGSG